MCDVTEKGRIRVSEKTRAYKLRGEWDDEEDELRWEHAGLQCVVLRVEHSGHLCGYVGVKKEHPWYGKSYMDQVHCPGLERRQVSIEKNGARTVFCTAAHVDLEKELASIVLLLQAHGGITYAQEGKADGKLALGTWWFGFDCAHCGDLQPLFAQSYGPMAGDEYRSMAFVIHECESLAEQLQQVQAGALVEDIAVGAKLEKAAKSLVTAMSCIALSTVSCSSGLNYAPLEQTEAALVKVVAQALKEALSDKR